MSRSGSRRSDSRRRTSPRSSYGFQSLRKKSGVNPPFPETLERAFEEDNNYLIARAVTEEIINGALAKCLEVHINKFSTKYVAQCLHEAWKRLLRVRFMYYDYSVVDYSDEKWLGEEPPEVSPVDTWAESSVPIKEKVQRKKSRKFSQTAIGLEEFSECEEESTETPYTPTPVFTTVRDEITLAEDQAEEEDGSLQLSFVEDSERFESLPREDSYFTSIAKSVPGYHAEQLRCIYLNTEVKKPKSECTVNSGTSGEDEELVLNSEFVQDMPATRLHGKFKNISAEARLSRTSKEFQ